MQNFPETRVSLILRLAKTTDVQAWQAFHETSILSKPAEEVAKKLGMPLGNLYVARCRVLKLLREEVQDLDSTLSGEWDQAQGNAMEQAEPLPRSGGKL